MLDYTKTMLSQLLFKLDLKLKLILAITDLLPSLYRQVCLPHTLVLKQDQVQVGGQLGEGGEHEGDGGDDDNRH